MSFGRIIVAGTIRGRSRTRKTGRKGGLRRRQKRFPSRSSEGGRERRKARKIGRNRGLRRGQKRFSCGNFEEGRKKDNKKEEFQQKKREREKRGVSLGEIITAGATQSRDGAQKTSRRRSR